MAGDRSRAARPGGYDALNVYSRIIVDEALRIVARAEDGIVEGIESDGFGRFLGVQWHPELLAGHAAHERLFTWLVTEAGLPAPAATTPSTSTAG